MMSELEITDEHKQCVSVAIISVPAPRTPARDGDGRQVMSCRVQTYHRLHTLCVRRNWILPLAGDVRRVRQFYSECCNAWMKVMFVMWRYLHWKAVTGGEV